MKKIMKYSLIFYTLCSTIVLISIPLALAKGAESGESKNDSPIIEKGEFAYPYARDNVPIYRGISNEHMGIDFNGAYGEEVLAVSDALVYKSSNTCPPDGGYLGNWCPFDNVSGGGNYVILKFEYNSKEVYIQYDHLEKTLVKTNEYVKKGQPVGRQGHSGNSTGTHLHLEAHYNGIYAGSHLNLINIEEWFK